jgi:hypothetical protein
MRQSAPLHQTRWAVLCCVIVSLLLTGCEATPTPFPVDIPVEPSATPIPTHERVIRYGLASNTREQVMDLAEIQAVAEVVYLNAPPDPQTLGTDYDLIVAYGKWDGAQQSPAPLNISLLINPNMPPLDNPTLAEVLQQGINPSALQNAILHGEAPVFTDLHRELRTVLANAGYPDGFELRLAHHAVPGVQALSQHLSLINIDLTHWALNEDLWAGQQAHLALVGWTDRATRDTWAQAIPDSYHIDLISLPISYWVLEDLPITFTTNGFPIPQHPPDPAEK